MAEVISHRVTVESSKWGSKTGYSKSVREFDHKKTFLTLSSNLHGGEAFSVRWADVDTIRVEAIIAPLETVDATEPSCVCRCRYKGKTVGELIDLTIKSIDTFQETGDSQRHREELAIIREEMKISHSLNRY
ncbi:hypothetical protein [Providencia rettgeri]|uniref:hypothetical protein n=1 Tax=Providencia rettgeri TaxID=587 RepID=UPI0023617D07|nr:hypothetical protein [Providencia rettgeri]